MTRLIGQLDNVVSLEEVSDNIKNQKIEDVKNQFDVDKNDFTDQLKKFKKDKNHKEEWKNVSIESNKYHLKVFTYSDKIKRHSTLLIHDIDGNVKLSSDTVASRKITNIAKVISVGKGVKDPEYTEGDLVLLNNSEVCGKAPNPVYVQCLQYARSFGGEQPIIPPGTPMEIESIQARWAEYYLTRPEDFLKPNHLIYDFAVPSHKIVAKYNGI